MRPKQYLPLLLILLASVACAAPKPLNSFVTELVDKDVVEGEVVYFERPTNGWIYIQTDSSLLLDYALLGLVGGQRMLYVESGVHSISASAGHITIRAIPEIIFYDFYKGTNVRTWQDIKQPAIWNTYNVMVGSHKLNEYTDEIAEWRAKGGKWIINAATTGVVRGPGQWHRLMTDPRADGIIVDEFLVWKSDKFKDWAKILKRIKADPASKGHMFYGFTAPGADPQYRPLLTTLLNQGYKIVPEFYQPEYSTETKADKIFADWAGRGVSDWLMLFPGMTSGQIVVALSPSDSGNYLWKWNRYPEVDFKVHLDRQFHALANSPAKLDGVTFWRAHYVSKQTMDVFNALVRHYLIEGNTERLYSEPYLVPFSPP